MSKISKTYPSLEITDGINKLKALGAERVAHEIEKQIFLTIQKWWALFHIARQIKEELLLTEKQ